MLAVKMYSWWLLVPLGRMQLADYWPICFVVNRVYKHPNVYSLQKNLF